MPLTQSTEQILCSVGYNGWAKDWKENTPQIPSPQQIFWSSSDKC